MKEGKVYVITGISGSGKDTTFAILASYISPLVNIKWSSPMKRMMEKAYGLAPLELESRDIRNQVITGHPEGITYLEMMVRCWKVFPQIDPMLGKRQLLVDVYKMLDSGINVAFTDTRNPEEVDELVKLAEAGYQLHLLSVSGDYGTAKDSDIYVREANQRLYKVIGYYYHLENKGSIYQLDRQIQRVLHRLRG